jgi:uncharacterized protein YoxC
MDGVLQSQIFFFISSIGFIFLWALLTIFLFYLIRATKVFNKIMDKVDKDINTIGDTTKEMLEEVRDSAVFGFLFKRRKSGRK